MAAPEAPLQEVEHGLVPGGEGWFVLDARDAPWRSRPGRGFSLPFEEPAWFPRVGITLHVPGPGEPIGLYHRESNEEDLQLHDEGWGGYPAEELALRRGAGVDPDRGRLRWNRG